MSSVQTVERQDPQHFESPLTRPCALVDEDQHAVHNRELEVDAAEIRIRAERRLGELIRARKETVGLAQGRRSDLVPAANQVKPTLAEAGIDKKLSSKAQKLAAVPEPEFEGMLGEWI